MKKILVLVMTAERRAVRGSYYLARHALVFYIELFILPDIATFGRFFSGPYNSLAVVVVKVFGRVGLAMHETIMMLFPVGRCLLSLHVNLMYWRAILADCTFNIFLF